MAKKTTEKSHLAQMLTELETLVEKMESETLSLEDSLKSFERGVQLIKECQKTLSTAEQKVKQLVDNELKEFSAE